MFDELMLHGDKLIRKSGNSVSVPIRLPWYRSLPVSCIERMDFSIDGKAVPAEKIAFISNGLSFPVSELVKLADTNWFVLDVMQAELTPDELLADGAHSVHMEMSLRIPYRDSNYGVAVDELYIQFAFCDKVMTL